MIVSLSVQQILQFFFRPSVLTAFLFRPVELLTTLYVYINFCISHAGEQLIYGTFNYIVC